MKNKIKLFDKLVYWEMINQIKITGFIAAAIFLVSGMITSLGLWVSVIGFASENATTFPGEFFYILLGLVFIFVPIMMKSVFTYQNRRNSSDFYHALPIKREVMFVSSMAAVLTWAIGIMIVATVLPVFTAIILPQYKMDFVGMFKVLGNILAMVILVMGGFSLGINLTGNNFTNIVVSLMILFVPRIISTAIYYMVQYVMPFLEMNSGISLVNNSYNLLFGWFLSAFSENPGQLHYMASWGYTVVLGIVLLVLGALAHKNRKSEMAAQASAYKLVQPVTRMIPAFLFGLLGIFFFLNLVFRFTWNDYYDENVEISLYWGMFSMLILSLLAYVIYELVTTRRWRKVAQSFKQLPILAGIIIGCGAIICCGINISLDKKVDADKMQYIEVGKLDRLEWLSYKGEIRIEDEDVFEIIEGAYNDQMDDLYDGDSYWENFDVVIGINQGGLTFYRIIHLTSEDMEVLTSAYMKAADAEDAKLELPRYNYDEMTVYAYDIPGGTSYYEEKELYNALRDDLKNAPYFDILDVSEEETLCTVNVYVYGGRMLDVDIPISKKTPKTYEYLIDGIDENDDFSDMLDSVVSELDEIVNAPETMEGYLSVYSLLYIDGEKIEVNDLKYEYITEIEDLEKIKELFERCQYEEGDTLFRMEGELSWYSEEIDYYDYRDFMISKRIPKALADEIMTFLEEFKY